MDGVFPPPLPSTPVLNASNISDTSSEFYPTLAMTGITLPSGIILQPGALPSVPNVAITSINAAFLDDFNMAITNYFDGLTKPLAAVL
jgi:hypothetical protein